MTTSPDFEVNGLRLELATRRMRGPLVEGGRPRRWVGWLAALPATLLIVVLLVVPAVWTVVIATMASPRGTVACVLVAAAALSAALTGRRVSGWGAVAVWSLSGGGMVAGLWLLGGTMDADGRFAYVRTLLWVVFGVVLVAAALVIAWWGRAARWLWLPLIVPFGVSAFVSGVAFRLIFATGARWLGVEGVGSYRLWSAVMLASAFLWTWLGFLVGLFRAGIRAIEADPVRAGYLFGDGGGSLLGRLYELLRPVVLIVGLAVGVAAARVFDVVLIGVPGSLEYRMESATVHWWRLSSEVDAGRAAAYALPLAVLIGAVAWLLQVGVRRHRSSWSRVRPDWVAAHRRAGAVRAAGVALVSGMALFPLGVLVWTGLRGHDGFGLAAVDDLWHDDGLLRSLQMTAAVAGVATVIVVAVALPVAYRLAALHPNGPLARMAVALLVVSAVMPAQIYLGPVDAFIGEFALSGTRIPLILLHAAAGLPIATLILRGALLAPQGSAAADALHGLASPGTIAQRVLASAGPALGAVAVLEFIQVWNDFFLGLMVAGAGGSPWSLLLWGEARQFEENAAQLAAGSLLSAILPVALLLVTWRRWVVPGLTGGVLR